MNKERSEHIQNLAVKEVINSLRHMQSKLQIDIDVRTLQMKRATEKQTQQKREKAELGKLIKKLESELSLDDSSSK